MKTKPCTVRYTTEEKMRYRPQEVWFPLPESVLEWDEDFHSLMLNDHLRMVAYEKAIKEVVKPDMTVIDLGTGTGILALWALEAGADHVYGIEVNPEQYTQALARIKKAGYSDRFTLIRKLSTDIATEELPSVDLLISEILGSLADNEGFATILNDAHRFLAPEGRMLPLHVTSHLVPVSATEAWKAVTRGDVKTLNSRYQLSQLLDQRGVTKYDLYYDAIIPHETYLAPPALVQEFRFQGNDPEEYERRIRYRVERGGLFTGFKGYFVAQLSKETVLDISGDDIEGRKTADCWKHCYLPLASPLHVEEGDVLELVFSRRKGSDPFEQTYTWQGAVVRDGQEIDRFHQATRR